MKVLAVASQLPYPLVGGGEVRLYNLYSRLARQHEITWICPIWPGNEEYVHEAERLFQRVIKLPSLWKPDPPTQGMRRLMHSAVAHTHWERLYLTCYGYVRAPGVYWLPRSPERLQVIEDMLASEPFDLLAVENMAAAELLPPKSGIPSVLTLFDMQSTLFKRARIIYATTLEDRLFYWPELAKIVRYERHTYERYDLAITMSEIDRKRLQRRCPALPAEVIPNGVDISYFMPQPEVDDGRTLVYIGHYAYPPNADAVRYFVRTIWPLVRAHVPDAQFVAVGTQPPADLAEHPGVKVTGVVPDIRPYLARATVVVAPLRVGGGTRIKIIEALATGKAVVSTTIGAEGLDIVGDRDLLLADEPETFAAAVIRLLTNPQLRANLGRNGRLLAEQRYNWDSLAQKQDQIFRDLVNRRRSDNRSS
jgi:polysaccharide biosynthesis protein PslH